MGQRFESTPFRFVAGALLTLALLASGYLLGITQFGPTPEPEPVIAEIAELDKLLEALQSMDETMGALADQVSQLHLGLTDLQTRVAHQEAAVDVLATTVLDFSGEMAVQADNTSAQLDVLVAAAESTALDTVLAAVQSMDASVADLAEQVAQLHLDLAGLQSQSNEQGLELETLAAGLQALSSDVASQAETTTAQLQALAAAWEAVDLGPILTAVQAVDQSVAGLTEQVAQLSVDLSDLQNQSGEQGAEVQALAAALRMLSAEVAGQAESTAAQLQELAEAIEVQAVAATAPVPAPAEVVPNVVQVAAEPVPETETEPPAPLSPDLSSPGVPRTPEKPKIILVKTAEADLALVMKIKANDTIWGIANRFESPPSDRVIREIIELNQVDPYQLRIGQDLLVPLNEDVFQLVEVE